MDTKVWGPPLWIATHIMAHNYDPNKHSAKDFKKFFEAFAQTLPCIYCRQSYIEFMRKLPIDKYLKDRPSKQGEERGLPFWWYQIHNMVNAKLRDQGQAIEDPKFVEVWKKYEQYRVSGCKKSCSTQCEGLTCDGVRCNRKSAPNKKTCYQH